MSDTVAVYAPHFGKISTNIPAARTVGSSGFNRSIYCGECCVVRPGRWIELGSASRIIWSNIGEVPADVDIPLSVRKNRINVSVRHPEIGVIEDESGCLCCWRKRKKCQNKNR